MLSGLHFCNVVESKIEELGLWPTILLAGNHLQAILGCCSLN
jgi:hypothetical protein